MPPNTTVPDKFAKEYPGITKANLEDVLKAIDTRNSRRKPGEKPISAGDLASAIRKEVTAIERSGTGTSQGGGNMSAAGKVNYTPGQFMNYLLGNTTLENIAKESTQIAVRDEIAETNQTLSSFQDVVAIPAIVFKEGLQEQKATFENLSSGVTALRKEQGDSNILTKQVAASLQEIVPIETQQVEELKKQTGIAMDTLDYTKNLRDVLTSYFTTEAEQEQRNNSPVVEATKKASFLSKIMDVFAKSVEKTDDVFTVVNRKLVDFSRYLSDANKKMGDQRGFDLRDMGGIIATVAGVWIIVQRALEGIGGTLKALAEWGKSGKNLLKFTGILTAFISLLEYFTIEVDLGPLGKLGGPEALGKFMDKFWEMVKSLAGLLGSTFELLGKVMVVLTPVFYAIGAVLAFTLEFLMEAITRLSKALTWFVDGITTYIVDPILVFYGFVITGGFQQMMTDAWTSLVSTFDIIVGALAEFFSWEGFIRITDEWGAAIDKTIDEFGAWADEQIYNMFLQLLEFVSPVTDWISNIWTIVSDWFTSLPGTVQSIVDEYIAQNPIAKAIGDMFTAIFSWIPTPEAIGKMIKDAILASDLIPQFVKDWINGGDEKLKEEATKAIPKVPSNWFESQRESLKNSIDQTIAKRLEMEAAMDRLDFYGQTNVQSSEQKSEQGAGLMILNMPQQIEVPNQSFMKGGMSQPSLKFSPSASGFTNNFDNMVFGVPGLK